MIPVCNPYLNGNEIKYVTDAVSSGWISSSGQYVTKFEEAFAAYCGVKHGIAVCNGTVALHLALTALKIGPGDEVIIPDFTMIASAFAVVYTGARPVFVDVDPGTWNIDVSRIEEKITPRTKAIMPVSIFGNPCDMDAIWRIARKHGIQVLEDAAESHGAEYLGKTVDRKTVDNRPFGKEVDRGPQTVDLQRERTVDCRPVGSDEPASPGGLCGSGGGWKKVGALADITAFSFFANKILTTGEGGMVVTDNDELAKRCRYFKNVCFPLDAPRSYIHADVGFNYRMSNLHAAVGLAQAEKADEYRGMRIRNAALYERGLKDIPGVGFQKDTPGSRPVHWMNGILIDPALFGKSRDALMAHLKSCGIETRLFFVGMHRQPSLIKAGCSGEGQFPVSDNLAANGLYLPSGSNLTAEEIGRVCEVIREYQKKG